MSTTVGEGLRNELKNMLGIPAESYDLKPEFRGKLERDGAVIEKWIWTSEPGSRVTSALYLPEARGEKVPA